MPVPLAKEIAVQADKNAAIREPLEFSDWAGDVGLHASISSSLGHKGRLLRAIVRLMRAKACLELGTGYGISAFFILSALEEAGEGRLNTIEFFEPPYRIAESSLKKRFGSLVDCHFGATADVLPLLSKQFGPVDFVFCDAGHSRESFVSDFAAISDGLSEGATMLLDDIFWADSRFRAPGDAVEGWRELVDHPRVAQAVVIGGDYGLLLLN